MTWAEKGIVGICYQAIASEDAEDWACAIVRSLVLITCSVDL
jgi:hypothetical protein